MCDGAFVLLISFGFPMVFIKKEFYSHFFAVYLDSLLSQLVECGVGCYWKNMFVGFFKTILKILFYSHIVRQL